MLRKQSKNIGRQRRHIRLRRKISGTASCPRLSVYRSNKHIHCQIIDDVTANTLVACSSVAMKINGSNIEGAKKVGEQIAKLALEKDIKNVVFDRGGYLYHGRIQALADAAREAGLEF